MTEILHSESYKSKQEGLGLIISLHPLLRHELTLTESSHSLPSNDEEKKLSA